MDSNLNRDFATDSAIEPLFGTAALVADGSGDLAAGYTATFFVDQIGQSAASNFAQAEGDSNLDGGVIPQGVAMELFDLTFFVTVADDSAYPTELILSELDRDLRVRMYYADQPYELGPFGIWRGPYGGTTGANNQVIPRKLCADGRRFVLEPAQKFKLELKAKRAIVTLTASKTYVVQAILSRRIARRGTSAARQ